MNYQCGENEEQNEEVVVGEQSPDVSLSSGPIEPLGAEDSGSEPESSHNDVSPPHNYALKNQHEWLKSHLRAATSEKNKLEELTAQLTEKAERLQYELADAKEAGKSRDEVIQLLQGQLARMEAAYTRSLEESVQSRLQLTSHEQEILHLKELCYRYQEEKEAATSGLGGDFLQDLQLKIKILEEEKEKMREEINHLEEEKSLLEGQLRQKLQGDAEVADQCQRWKERCKELEEMVKAYASKKAECESCVKEKAVELIEQEQSFKLQKKLAEAREENMELKAEVESLGMAVEREKRRTLGTEKEKEELLEELKRRKVEAESELIRMEKEMEEQWVRKLKEKEEEMRAVVDQLKLEKEQRLEEKVTKELGGEGKKAERSAGRRRVKRERELSWSSRYGLTEMRRRGGRLSLVEEGTNAGMREQQEEGVRNGDLTGLPKGGVLGEIMARCEQETVSNRSVHDLEYLELKKQILSLESKMTNEKNLRHSLENEILKMRVSLNEKENLEMEVDSLKRKVGMQWLGKSGVELLEYERDLQAKREKYLTGGDKAVQQSSDDYKAKCQVLAREREKFKQLTKSFRPTPKTFFCKPSSPSPTPNLHPYPFSHPQLLLHPPQLLLHPHLKNNLDYQLDKSMHRYIQGSPSTHSISNTQI